MKFCLNIWKFNASSTYSTALSASVPVPHWVLLAEKSSSKSTSELLFDAGGSVGNGSVVTSGATVSAGTAVLVADPPATAWHANAARARLAIANNILTLFFICILLLFIKFCALHQTQNFFKTIF